MKKLRSLPYLVIFLVNLLVGFLGGSKVFPERAGNIYPMVELAVQMDNPIPAMANGQRSILLITVDKLDARKPRLTGVWALLYVPTNPRLTLIPVFPTLNNRDTKGELAKSFKIQQEASSRKLDPTFIRLIQEQIPWWSGHIILDQRALAEVVDLWVYSSGMISNNSPSNDDKRSAKNNRIQIISDLSDAWDDPYSALFSQASLYQELCWGMAWSEIDFKTSQTQELVIAIRKHFSSDLDPELILTEILNLRDLGGNFICEFPTLSVQARVIK
jgi:hypothetical protein